MLGAGRGRPATVVPVKAVPVKAVPVGLAPGMPGRALAAPVTVADGMVEPAMGADGMADGMGRQEMPAVSRFAERQAVPGMRFVPAVGVNVPTGIAPPAVLLPVIGPTEPAAAQIGPSLAIGPDLSVSLRMWARQNAAPLSGVPLSAVPLSGDPSIAVLVAVPRVVQLGALVPPVLGPAGRMGPGPTVAILLPPALTAAEIGQAPGR